MIINDTLLEPKEILPRLYGVHFPPGTVIRTDREGAHITLPDGVILLVRAIEPAK